MWITDEKVQIKHLVLFILHVNQKHEHIEFFIPWEVIVAAVFCFFFSFLTKILFVFELDIMIGDHVGCPQTGEERETCSSSERRRMWQQQNQSLRGRHVISTSLSTERMYVHQQHPTITHTHTDEWSHLTLEASDSRNRPQTFRFHKHIQSTTTLSATDHLSAASSSWIVFCC